jgi:hypothetical protein
MSDFKHYDEEPEDGDFLYEEDFDADTFVDAMSETAQLRRRPARPRPGRSALELIERRNEERWLRAQLSDLDDEEFLH